MAQTTKQLGYILEARVVRMFRRMGKYNIKRNVLVRDANGNLSEFDVTYGYIFRRYIECKNYTHPVPLEAVAKFKEVLKLNGIPVRHGIFITTSTFTPRATTIGVNTIDGAQLKKMEKSARIRWTFRMGWWVCGGALCATALYAHYTVPGGIYATYQTYERKAKRWWRNFTR